MLQEIYKAITGEGRNVCISGPAGTGKSFLAKQIAEMIPGTVKTASTGTAACNVGGVTIHSFAGISTHSDPRYVEEMKKNKKKWAELQGKLRETKLLILDEASMIRRDTFELIDLVFRGATGKDSEPFGGIQLVIIADFLQLPPIVKKEEGFERPFIFQSPIWSEARFQLFQLTEIHRQDDPTFIHALHEIRQGTCSPETEALFLSRVDAELAPGIEPTRFVPLNAMADEINANRISALPGPEKLFIARVWGENSGLKRQIAESCIAPTELRLKVGAQVLVLKNDTDCARFINGSMARVLDLTDDNVTVRIEKTGTEVVFSRHEWSMKDITDAPLASFRQIPLKPAYAVTIHKSQGMTLENADVDCKGMFAPGQLYVGLSRVRTLGGLRLRNWSRWSVKASNDAKEFYRNPPCTIESSAFEPFRISGSPTIELPPTDAQEDHEEAESQISNDANSIKQKQLWESFFSKCNLFAGRKFDDQPRYVKTFGLPYIYLVPRILVSKALVEVHLHQRAKGELVHQNLRFASAIEAQLAAIEMNLSKKFEISKTDGNFKIRLAVCTIEENPSDEAISEAAGQLANAAMEVWDYFQGYFAWLQKKQKAIDQAGQQGTTQPEGIA